MQAVTPEPQLVTGGRAPSTPACANRARSSATGTERSVSVQQIGVGNVRRTRDMPAAHAGARLRRGAGEAARGARIQHQFRPRFDIAQHVADAAQPRSAEIRTEGRGGRRGRFAGLRGAALLHPFRQSAVQHGGIVVAEQPHQPPAARRRGQPLLVVEHHARPVADAQAGPSVWRNAQAQGPCAAGRCRYRRSRRYRNSAPPEYARRGIRRAHPWVRSAGISSRRTPRGPACRVPRQANRSSPAVPCIPPNSAAAPVSAGEAAKSIRSLGPTAATGAVTWPVASHHCKCHCELATGRGGRPALDETAATSLSVMAGLDPAIYPRSFVRRWPGQARP